MAALSSMNDYINRASNGYIVHRHFSVQRDTGTGNVYVGQIANWQLSPRIYQVETMPTGVTAFKLTNATLYSNTTTAPFFCVKLVTLGSFDIGTQVYTDGSTMPIVTEGGVSRRVYSGVLQVITTNFDAVAAAWTITYFDQDGNIAPVSPSMSKSLGQEVGSAGFATLNAGDYGCTDISGAARTSGTGAGVITFYGVIPLGTFSPVLQTTNTAMQFNNLTDAPCPPILSAGDEIYLLTTTQTAKAFRGTLTFIGDQA